MQGDNLLAASGKPLFFPVGNFSGLGLPPPTVRRADAVRLWARSLTVMQKEAVVVSAKTGRAWRLASDEGAYLNGFDEAPENGGGGRAPDAQSYIAAGLGFCFMTQFGRYAKIVRRELSQYDIAQDLHFSAGGGGAGAADPAETHVYLQTGAGDDFARAALDMGERTCFLHALCRTDLQVETASGGRA